MPSARLYFFLFFSLTQLLLRLTLCVPQPQQQQQQKQKSPAATPLLQPSPFLAPPRDVPVPNTATWQTPPATAAGAAQRNRDLDSGFVAGGLTFFGIGGAAVYALLHRHIQRLTLSLRRTTAELRALQEQLPPSQRQQLDADGTVPLRRPTRNRLPSGVPVPAENAGAGAGGRTAFPPPTAAAGIGGGVGGGSEGAAARSTPSLAELELLSRIIDLKSTASAQHRRLEDLQRGVDEVLAAAEVQPGGASPSPPASSSSSFVLKRLVMLRPDGAPLDHPIAAEPEMMDCVAKLLLLHFDLDIPKSIPKLEWNEDIDVCAGTLEMARGHAISAADRDAWLLHDRAVIEVKAVEAPAADDDSGDNRASGNGDGGGAGSGGPLPLHRLSSSPVSSSSASFSTGIDASTLVAALQQRGRFSWRRPRLLPSAVGRLARDFGQQAWRGVVGGSAQSAGRRSSRGRGGIGSKGGKVMLFRGRH